MLHDSSQTWWHISLFNLQCKTFGLEGNELWLAASTDRRVSVWAADWLKDKCDLLDWLTFPAPSFFGVLFHFFQIIYLFWKIWWLEPLGLWYLWLFSCSTWFGEWLLTVRHMFLESWFLCFKGWCSPSQSGCLCSHRPQSGGLHWLWSRERADLLQPC